MTITLTLNGEACQLPAGITVAELLRRMTVGEKGVAVAVNRSVVPRSTWERSHLGDGDRVEILNAAQGG